MCKIVVLNNSSKIKKDDFKKLTKAVSVSLGQTETEGFGFSVLTDSGVFSQRYVNPSSVRSDLLLKTKPFSHPSMNQSGNFGSPTGAAMFHGRISTNQKSLINTHPIEKHGWSLIHNGVVEDSGPKYKMLTTNDTEHCLERLVQGIDQVEKHISGYYALAAIDTDGRLHLVRDSIAHLFCAFVESIDSYIFATTEYLIKDTCKTMNWAHDSIEKVHDDIYLIFNNRGELVSQSDIKPKGYTYETTKYAEKSLGRKLDYDDYDTQNFYDEDRDLFLEEVSTYADSTYVFINKKSGKPVNYQRFIKLTDEVMVNEYTVIRSDGTICSPTDYHTDAIYEGAS